MVSNQMSVPILADPSLTPESRAHLKAPEGHP